MPFEVPEGWCWCRLEDYFELLSGQDFPPEKYNDAQNGIPYIIGASNLYMGKIVINRWTQTPSVKTTKGDLLVVCKGAGVGKMALNDIGDMHIARQIQAIRDVSKMMSIEYIKMVVSYYIEDIIADANGLIPGLKRELLLSLLMPIPPLQEQRRIITTFEKLMSFIESIDNDSLELTKAIKIAQSKILDLAIHGRLVPQDANDEPASELLKRINPKAVASCDNPQYGKVPSGWVWCKIEDIFKVVMGQSPNGDSVNHKFIGVEFHQGKLFFSQCIVEKSDVYTTSPTKLADKDSLLVCVRAPVGDVNITDREICIGRGLCALKPLSNLPLDYWFYAIKSLKAEFNKKATGSTFLAISAITIKNQVISLPPYKEQLRIVSKINELFSQLDMIEKSLQA